MPEPRGGNAGCSLNAAEYKRFHLYLERTKQIPNRVVKRAIKELLDREFNKGVSKK